MKKHKMKYTNERIGKIKIVDDFLPKPKDLVFKEETAKIYPRKFKNRKSTINRHV